MSKPRELASYTHPAAPSGQQPDPRPGAYFVSAVDGPRWWPMAGPFNDNHAAALALVEAAREAAVARDPRAHWMAFGTVRLEHDHPRAKLPGPLNAALGVVS